MSYPNDVRCGPDGRLYFNGYGMLQNRLRRIEQSGQANTTIAEWSVNNLYPSSMVFAPNGDLYFGTLSTLNGRQTQGIWRISEALQAGTEFKAPQQVIPGGSFSGVPGGRFGGVVPSAFQTVGPYAGNLFILDNPDGSAPPQVQGQIWRAEPPDFKTLKTFVAKFHFTPAGPAGLAINSKGEVLVTDFANSNVLMYNPDGTFKRVFAQVDRANQIAIGATQYSSPARFSSGPTPRAMCLCSMPRASCWGVLSTGSPLRGVTICSQPSGAG